MGNQLCCEEAQPQQPQYQVTVIHKKQSVKAPELNQAVSHTLLKQRPFQNELLSKPILKEFGDDIYEGKTDERGRPEGYGKMYYKNQSVFLGKFQYGAANGPGFYVKSDGSFYRGLMVDNKAEDENGYFWSEGYEYKGGIKNNQPHGQGREYGSSHEYEGEYIHGKKTVGSLKWKEADFDFIYTGGFNEQDAFEGEGELKQRYGTYKGEFREGKKDGKGKFYYQSELRYEGDYKDNKKEGLGKVVNRNETIAYEGQFKNGLPHGKGVAPNKEGRLQKEWIEGIDSIFLEE